MNKMDSKYMDEVPTVEYPQSIQDILETARMDLNEAKCVLEEIWNSLDAKERIEREEMKIPDLKTEAIAVSVVSKDIVAIAHEIFNVRFRQH